MAFGLPLNVWAVNAYVGLLLLIAAFLTFYLKD
jgi:hypothetical protein